MALIDNGIYVDGRRVETPSSLAETFEAQQAHGGMAWIGLYRPDDAELRAVADEFQLHELAIEDASTGHQRPKLERYDDTLFVVLRPARYLDASETVEFGELHLFVGATFIVTVRHAERPDLSRVRARLERSPELLAMGPQVVLHAMLDQVVDDFGPVMAGLENDIDEIEDQLFAGDPSVSRRIYELTREVIGVQRAVRPLTAILEGLMRGADRYGLDLELQRGLRDVLDHVLSVVGRVDEFRSVLENALTVASTLVSQSQNDEVRRMTEIGIAQNDEIKRISSWAAILFAPTLVGTVYGMNFDLIPELHWQFGYGWALGLMAATSVGLWAVFKWRKWL